MKFHRLNFRQPHIQVYGGGGNFGGSENRINLKIPEVVVSSIPGVNPKTFLFPEAIPAHGKHDSTEFPEKAMVTWIISQQQMAIRITNLYKKE